MASRVVAMVTRGEMEGRDCSCISPTKPEVMLPETTPTGRRPSLVPGGGEGRKNGQRVRERVCSAHNYTHRYILHNYKIP